MARLYVWFTPKWQQSPSHSRRRQQTAAEHTATVSMFLLITAVLVTAAAADERGVFTTESFKADMSLTQAAKSRKAGPNHTVGPVPAGVAWDGKHSQFCVGVGLGGGVVRVFG